MAGPETTFSTSGEHLPSYFVVEIKVGAHTHYALCERMNIAASGAESLPASVFETLYGEHPLRAVALPPDPQHPALTQTMALLQSGKSPSINITINNNDTN
jgi:hypothetical protein